MENKAKEGNTVEPAITLETLERKLDQMSKMILPGPTPYPDPGEMPLPMPLPEDYMIRHTFGLGERVRAWALNVSGIVKVVAEIAKGSPPFYLVDIGSRESWYCEDQLEYDWWCYTESGEPPPDFPVPLRKGA
jgi:hypothetical protein